MGTSNTFQSMAPDFKEAYSDKPKKKRFGRLRKHWQKKATAELDASKDPQKFMDSMKNPSIKGTKGVAF